MIGNEMDGDLMNEQGGRVMPIRLLWTTMAIWLLMSSQSVPMVLASEEGLSKKPWLGAYVGSTIPGYVVKSSYVIDSSGAAKIQKGITASVVKDLIATCQGDGGLALINYRSSITIGRVPMSSSDSKSSVIDPGIFMHGIADCVENVEALKEVK